VLSSELSVLSCRIREWSTASIHNSEL